MTSKKKNKTRRKATKRLKNAKKLEPTKPLTVPMQKPDDTL